MCAVPHSKLIPNRLHPFGVFVGNVATKHGAYTLPCRRMGTSLRVTCVAIFVFAISRRGSRKFVREVNGITRPRSFNNFRARSIRSVCAYQGFQPHLKLF